MYVNLWQTTVLNMLYLLMGWILFSEDYLDYSNYLKSDGVKDMMGQT